ncbi:MAG: alpha/beta fold hydrolase [Kiloniellaceae bacterium]
MSAAAADSPLWEREGRDWPNREASRFVAAGGLEWHVQIAGHGPLLLLLHGTGASTHSWRDLLPLLARDFTVVAPDLPGHGFTQAPPLHRLSLPGMARALQALLQELEVAPALAAGHSAGAAILAHMCLHGLIAPQGLVSINGALLALCGLPGHFFAPVARVLSQTSLAARLFAWRAQDPTVVNRLLRDTGSRLDARGVELYRRLARKPAHVGAALGMMANWRLERLEADLPQLAPPLLLVVGGRDGTIPPSQAVRVQALVPGSELITLDRLGHLAHEEVPERLAEIFAGFARRCGVLETAETV